MGWITENHHAVLVGIIGGAAQSTISPKRTSTKLVFFGEFQDLIKDALVIGILMRSRGRRIILVLVIVRMIECITCLWYVYVKKDGSFFSFSLSYHAKFLHNDRLFECSCPFSTWWNVILGIRLSISKGWFIGRIVNFPASVVLTELLPINPYHKLTFPPTSDM